MLPTIEEALNELEIAGQINPGLNKCIRACFIMEMISHHDKRYIVLTKRIKVIS